MNMFRGFVYAVLLISIFVTNTRAGRGGGERGEAGLFGFGHDRGGFDFDLGLGRHEKFGWGGLALGFGFFDPERLQSRFDSRFEDLQANYDEGVANTEDFFSTDDYTDIVDGTERLSDKYELFVSGVDRSIDRLGNFIDIANDDLTYYNDLLADFQARDDLSESRLERIEAWITRITDRLTDKIDLLTEKQTTLSDNLPTYQAFQTDIDAFLADIIAAGGGATETTSDVAMASIAASMFTVDEVTTAAVDSSIGVSAAAELSPSTVPEPAALALGFLAVGAIPLLRAQRARELR
jgi:hypothetical protein